MLKGYKTYILGGVTILGYVAAYLVGDASLADTVNMTVTAGLAIFLRNGIAHK